MKNLNDFIPLAEVLVNELSGQIDIGQMTLKEAEEKILSFINRIGQFMLETVIHGIKEPTCENRIIIGDTEAVYRDMQNLRLKNRFGGEIVRQRRSYKIIGS